MNHVMSGVVTIEDNTKDKKTGRRKKQVKYFCFYGLFLGSKMLGILILVQINADFKPEGFRFSLALATQIG